MSFENRYANDWDGYSQKWETECGKQYHYLGDEWNEDGTSERLRDNFYFLAFADRWLHSQMTVLEVGPGGGKWTVRIAPKVKRLIVLDVSQEMLNRTRARCEEHDIHNVEYFLGNGRDFGSIADQSVDFFFSFDVFVHIALEDLFPYVGEILRVLNPGGVGVCHQAINSVPSAWNRIEQNNEWYRGGKHSLGQYYYFGGESLRRLYEHWGFEVLEQHQEQWNCTTIFKKNKESILPELELLLNRLISEEANDQYVRNEITTRLKELPAKLSSRLEPTLVQAQGESDYCKRVYMAGELRRIWRSI